MHAPQAEYVKDVHVGGGGGGVVDVGGGGGFGAPASHDDVGVDERTPSSSL
jgi:hypothetical protein